MSRKKLRVPGRYERPAQLRGPLGTEGRAFEQGVRRGYATAPRAREAVRQHARRQRAGVTPPQVDAGTHDEILVRHRQLCATVKNVVPD